MFRLREIQEAFTKGMTEGKYNAVADTIVSGGSSLRGVALYRRLIRTNYTQVLSVTYPVLRRFVGPRYFGFLARGYLTRYPSASGDLFAYGRHLPALLRELQVPGLLVELARLEWACHDVHQGADAPPISYDQLATAASADPSRVILVLSPTVRLVRLSRPVHRLWFAFQAEASANKHADLPLDVEETGVAVARAGGAIHVKALAALDYRLLEAIAERKTAAELEQIALQGDREFDFSRFMAFILQLGLLGGVEMEVRA
ncbi:MAG: putative DNA-binding domain-containing protein [Nitrospiraceae bacterium]|nr:putative DNA-binding domain-containing protein [Nitrospiraceae bacterium]